MSNLQQLAEALQRAGASLGPSRTLDSTGTITGGSGEYAEYTPTLSRTQLRQQRSKGPSRQVLKEARGQGNQGDHLARRQHSRSKYSPH